MAPRRRTTPRRQRRRTSTLHRLLPLLLHQMGPILGIPGPTKSPPHGRRHEPRPTIHRPNRPPSVASLRPRKLRQRCPSHAPQSRKRISQNPRRPPHQTRPRGTARRRIHRPTTPTSTRPQRHPPTLSRHPRSPKRTHRRWLHRPQRRPGHVTLLPLRTPNRTPRPTLTPTTHPRPTQKRS